MQPKPYGIMFHHFYNQKHFRAQGALSAREFDRLLLAVGIDQILPSYTWLKMALNGRLKPGQICLTFDDTLLSAYEIALPVLRKYHLTAFWFTYSNVLVGEINRLEIYRKFRSTCFKSVSAYQLQFFNELATLANYPLIQTKFNNSFNPKLYDNYPFYTYNDRRYHYLRDHILKPKTYQLILDQMLAQHSINVTDFSRNLWLKPSHLKELDQEGHVVGLHSHTHPNNLKDLPASSQKQEYLLNYQILTKILGHSPETMSHPANSYNQSILKILKQLKIKIGFAADMDHPQSDLLTLPRQDCANLSRLYR